MNNKFLISIILFLIAGSLSAQINLTNNPNIDITGSSVFLDASTGFSAEAGQNNNIGKGIVVPAVNLVNFEFDLTLADGITFPTYFDGMLVYNNATGTTLTTGDRSSTATVVTPGFYYFSNPNGATNGNVTAGVWKPVGGSTNTSGWSKSGNAGTDGGTNDFIGTTDTTDFVIKTSNSQSLQVTKRGKVRLVKEITDSEFAAGGDYSKLRFELSDNATTSSNVDYLTGSDAVISKRGSGNTEVLFGYSGGTKQMDGSTGSITNMAAYYNYLSKSGAGNITNMYGAHIFNTWDATSAGTVTNYKGYSLGGFFRGSANITKFDGMNLQLSPSFTSSSTIGEANGAKTYFNWNTEAQTTSYAGFNSYFFTGGAGLRVTDMYAFYSNGISGATMFGASNTITNAYGLYLGNISKGATLNYGIFTNAGLNSFGDNIELRGTGYLKLATGTSAQRPATASAGMIRFNTSISALEYYDGSSWISNGAATSIATKSANYSLTTSDRTILMNCTSAALTVTLPAVASSIGRTIVISKIDNSTNALTFSLPVYFSLSESITKINYSTALTLQCDGTNWWVIAKN